MKLVVISDSHGDIFRVQKIIDRETPFDMLIHCGDGAADPLRANMPEGASLVRVSGNVDRYSSAELEEQELIDVCGFKIMVVHGDRYGVNYGDSKLRSMTGCDAVFFGHTHIKHISPGRPVLLNPGPANRGSYAIVFLDSDTRSIRPEFRNLAYQAE